MVAALAAAFRFVGHVILLLLFAAGAAALNSYGFQEIERARQIERTPPTEPIAVLPGEVILRGAVHPGDRLLEAPHTKVRCVYFRLLVEEERRDSDGDRSWHTISDESSSVDFLIGDDRARVLVDPAPRVLWRFDGPSRTDRIGDRRYTEWRVEPGHEVFLFGMAERRGDRIEVGFLADGAYTPIITRRGEADERRTFATHSVFAVWGSMALLSLCVVTLCSVFRIHHVFTYQALVAGAITLGLVYTGLTMVGRDLRNSAGVLARHREEAQAEFQRVFGAQGHAWDGDFASIASVADPRLASLDPLWRDRLLLIWADLHRATERTNRQRDAIPERWLAPLWGIPREAAIPLPDALREVVASREHDFAPAAFDATGGHILIGVGLGLALLLSWAGFRFVKVKRYIENIPTSSTRGVAYGLVELKGTAATPAGFAALDGPISGARCVQYRYMIQEKRGSGKNAKWVTIRDETQAMPFELRDDSGAITVHPWGAEIITDHSVSRSVGRQRHTETSLRAGDRLYVLGSAELNPHTMESLIVGRGPKDMPFILTNRREEDILFSKGRTGLVVLNLSLVAMILAAMLGFAVRGGFAPTDYLASAFVALAYLLVLLLVFTFNDFVFLRQLVRRNLANIDVSLKKRADLLPRLEAVVKGYMAHERDLLEAVTSLRAKYGGGALPDLTALADFLEAEDAFVEAFIGRREEYPELWANEQFAALSRRLVELENEVALMRDGYNALVRIYNEAVGKLPEALLARACRFEEAAYLKAAMSVHSVPRVSLEPASALSPEATPPMGVAAR